MSPAKVTVVGAGNVGATVAQLILMRGLADVVMVDVAVGLAEGKALDMQHMRALLDGGSQIIGTGDYGLTAGSDIVVVTAGVPRKPGMSREELLAVNAGIVQSVFDAVLAGSPDALYLLVTNPLDVMVNYAWRLSGLPRQRVFGMGGVLDGSRFANALAKRLGCLPSAVQALVIGAHGEAMLPLPRLAEVDGHPLTELLGAADIAAAVEETIGAGAAVVELLQTGSAYYAPAASIAAMVGELLAPSGQVMSVSAGLDGEYGISGVHLGVPVRLGPTGVEEIIELELTDEELAALHQAAQAIEGQLQLL
ncbi:MAG: malate dehydrogenase [Coriobacteriia bacterium]|nr:malate dehydrogenase [Coriobacteriia bacterium]